MLHEFKARVAIQVFDVALAAGEQVVHADHFVAEREDAVYQVAARKPAPPVTRMRLLGL